MHCGSALSCRPRRRPSRPTLPSRSHRATVSAPGRAGCRAAPQPSRGCSRAMVDAVPLPGTRPPGARSAGQQSNAGAGHGEAQAGAGGIQRPHRRDEISHRQRQRLGRSESRSTLRPSEFPFPVRRRSRLLNGSVAVSYALDLFGANRRLIEGLNAQAEYQKWQLQGARLMLAGNVVSAAIRQAQLRSQIDITRQMLALQEQQRQHHRAALCRWRSLRIRHQQPAHRGRADAGVIPPLEQQLDVVNHQLAVLIGKTPAEAHIESHQPRQPAASPGAAAESAIVAGAAASRHSCGRSVAASGQCQCRRSDRQPLSANCAFRKRRRNRNQLHQRRRCLECRGITGAAHLQRRRVASGKAQGSRSLRRSRQRLYSKRCCRLSAKSQTRCAPSSTTRKLCRREPKRPRRPKHLPDRIATLHRRRHQPTRAARCPAPALADRAGSGHLRVEPLLRLRLAVSSVGWRMVERRAIHSVGRQSSGAGAVAHSIEIPNRPIVDFFGQRNNLISPAFAAHTINRVGRKPTSRRVVAAPGMGSGLAGASEQHQQARARVGSGGGSRSARGPVCCFLVTTPREGAICKLLIIIKVVILVELVGIEVSTL